MGTVAYMAPEQARGHAVDKRADVWAFGCVLFELLAGRRAFERKDAAETMAAILRDTPDWSALPPVPSAVTALLHACLERDPPRRIGDMSTIRFVLDRVDALGAAGCVGPSATGDAAPRGAGRPARSRRRAWPSGLLCIGLLQHRWASRDSPSRCPRGRRSRQRSASPFLRMGGRLPTVANHGLYLRRLSEFDADQVPIVSAGDDITSPAFSPDGESIAFHAEGRVKRVSVHGGTATAVCDVLIPRTYMAWQEHGDRGRCRRLRGSPVQPVRRSAGDNRAREPWRTAAQPAGAAGRPECRLLDVPFPARFFPRGESDIVEDRWRMDHERCLSRMRPIRS